MIVDGSIHKSGFPIVFEPVLIKPIKDKHILTPFELKIKALFKKMLAKKNKGKKKKTKNKGGGKSKYNIKMTRKFRRTRRKRGSGPGGDEPVRKTKEEKAIEGLTSENRIDRRRNHWWNRDTWMCGPSRAGRHCGSISIWLADDQSTGSYRSISCWTSHREVQ